MVVGFLILEVNFFNHDNDSEQHDSMEIPTPSLNIISRKEWNAMNSSTSLHELNLPVESVILAHTVTSECDTKARH